MSEPLTHSWYPGELEIWRKKEELTVSRFAAKHRKVTLGAHQGEWDNSITPYLVRIMDSYNLPWVQEIVIKGVPQSGKSNACINMHLYAIVYRGGNVKYVMLPKENLAKKIAKDRLIPIYRQCGPVAAKLSANPDDTTASRIAFRDGTVIYPVWGSSPSEISSFPADDVLADEVDKNEDLAGKETHALNLMEKRATTFRRPKKIKCSSPAGAGSLISKAFDDCVQQFDYHPVCPHCGHREQMKEENLTWPGQLELVPGSGASAMQPAADHKKVLNDKSARYACGGCGALWNDLDRDRAVRLASALPDQGWLPRQEVERPGSVGFTIDGLICPDISLSEYASAILKARSGDVADQIELDNSYRARKYEPQQQSRKEDEILRLIDYHLPRAVVPRETNSLVIVADTQKHGFYYEVVAFGWGRELGRHIVDHGYVEQFEHLVLLQNRDWFAADGARFRARSGFIDSGGGSNPYQPKHSRTREVYDFCIENPFWHPLKGKQRQTTPISWTRLDYYPGSDGRKIAIPGGLVLYTIDTTYYKNTLARKLKIDPGNPGAVTLHAGLSLEEMEGWSSPQDPRHEGQARWHSYAKQMCAESQDERGFWENAKNAPNHHWDIGQYSYAAADILYIGDDKRPEETTEAEPEAPKTAMRHKSSRW